MTGPAASSLTGPAAEGVVWTCCVCGLPNDAVLHGCATCRAARPGFRPVTVEDQDFVAGPALRVLPIVAGILVAGLVLAVQVGELTRWGTRGTSRSLTQEEREGALRGVIDAIRAHLVKVRTARPGPLDPDLVADLGRVRGMWTQQDSNGARPQLAEAERELATAMRELASAQGALARGIPTEQRLAALDEIEARLRRAETLVQQ